SPRRALRYLLRASARPSRAAPPSAESPVRYRRCPERPREPSALLRSPSLTSPSSESVDYATDDGAENRGHGERLLGPCARERRDIGCNVIGTVLPEVPGTRFAPVGEPARGLPIRGRPRIDPRGKIRSALSRSSADRVAVHIRAHQRCLRRTHSVSCEQVTCARSSQSSRPRDTLSAPK